MAHNARPDTIAPVSIPIDCGAAALGIARSTLYRLIARGEIETFTIGRKRLIAVEALQNYVRRRSTT